MVSAAPQVRPKAEEEEILIAKSAISLQDAVNLLWPVEEELPSFAVGIQSQISAGNLEASKVEEDVAKIKDSGCSYGERRRASSRPLRKRNRMKWGCWPPPAPPPSLHLTPRPARRLGR